MYDYNGYRQKKYLGAEILDGESLNGVDVEGGVRVHGGETSRDYVDDDK